ncbi:MULTISPECIES: hypothetical protein [unclassified Brevibacterium]|uniref:hypothetical protein n=1 Tax=unclassified Brevibacterium TaxID=2614124 RepID=UPI001091CF35|nr:hypothetical protein [Brevibacterium sp. S22]
MARPLSTRERSVALLMIRSATTSPDEADYAKFTPEQREGWDPPVPITTEQRRLWESSLGEVLVTSECDCGTCPSIGMRPHLHVDDESRDDQGGDGDWSNRVVLAAGTAGAMLLLFIDDGCPSYLELAPIDDDLSFGEFPDPASVEV